MKIKMLRTEPGALDGGLRVVPFTKGRIYDTKDMEGIGEIFLDIKAAEEHIPDDYEKRHAAGLSGAPLNARVTPPENKEKVLFTAEELEGSSAKDIRKLAEDNGVSLEGSLANTSAKTLISMYLERQDN